MIDLVFLGIVMLIVLLVISYLFQINRSLNTQSKLLAKQLALLEKQVELLENPIYTTYAGVERSDIIE